MISVCEDGGSANLESAAGAESGSSSDSESSDSESESDSESSESGTDEAAPAPRSDTPPAKVLKHTVISQTNTFISIYTHTHTSLTLTPMCLVIAQCLDPAARCYISFFLLSAETYHAARTIKRVDTELEESERRNKKNQSGCDEPGLRDLSDS